MAQNRSWTVRASSTLSASDASDTYTNRDGRGLKIVIKNTDAGGGTSPTLTVKVQYYNAAAGWVDLAGAATSAIAADAAHTTELTIHPELTAAANDIVKEALPKVWRLYYTLGGTGTPTAVFSVDANLLV
jgi:hypothetical protein